MYGNNIYQAFNILLNRYIKLNIIKISRLCFKFELKVVSYILFDDHTI